MNNSGGKVEELIRKLRSLEQGSIKEHASVLYSLGDYFFETVPGVVSIDVVSLLTSRLNVLAKQAVKKNKKDLFKRLNTGLATCNSMQLYLEQNLRNEPKFLEQVKPFGVDLMQISEIITLDPGNF